MLPIILATGICSSLCTGGFIGGFGWSRFLCAALRGWQRMRWLDSIIDSKDMSLSKLWEIVEDRKPGVRQSMGVTRSDMT